MIAYPAIREEPLVTRSRRLLVVWIALRVLMVCEMRAAKALQALPLATGLKR
jgi:hypothetical protein